MKIGIIGTGAMAIGIGRHAIDAGYDVMLSNTLRRSFLRGTCQRANRLGN